MLGKIDSFHTFNGIWCQYMFEHFCFHYYHKNQWRREDIGSGGRILVLEGGYWSWPPKGYHPPPHAGGPGSSSPRMVAKLIILKRFQVLENKSIFQKYHHFSCPKNLFILRTISKNRTYFTKLSCFFERLFSKILVL